MTSICVNGRTSKIQFIYIYKNKMEIYTYQQSDTLNIFNNYIATRDKVIKYLHSHKITKEYGVDIFSQIKKSYLKIFMLI